MLVTVVAVRRIVPSVAFEIVSPFPNVISFPVTVKSQEDLDEKKKPKLKS